MADKKFYVISYDIVDNKKRTKAAEALKDYGFRVQKSVFEARLSAKTLDILLERLQKIIDKKTDNILIYWLCETCVGQKRFIGQKIIGINEEDFRVL